MIDTEEANRMGLILLDQMKKAILRGDDTDAAALNEVDLFITRQVLKELEGMANA